MTRDQNKGRYFRSAVLSDEDEIIALYKHVIAQMNDDGIDQWTEEYPNREILHADIECNDMLICCVDKKISACIVHNEYQDPEYQTVKWEYTDSIPAVLHRLCVDPNMHGRGIGKAIMAEAERIVKEQGYRSIRLDTYSKNEPAINFYESLGYERRGDVFFTRGLFHCFEKSLMDDK